MPYLFVSFRLLLLFAPIYGEGALIELYEATSLRSSRTKQVPPGLSNCIVIGHPYKGQLRGNSVYTRLLRAGVKVVNVARTLLTRPRPNNFSGRANDSYTVQLPFGTSADYNESGERPPPSQRRVDDVDDLWQTMAALRWHNSQALSHCRSPWHRWTDAGRRAPCGVYLREEIVRQGNRQHSSRWRSATPRHDRFEAGRARRDPR
jgi:hypothetical protein